MHSVKVSYQKDNHLQQTTLFCEDKENLLQVLQEGKIPIHCACNGVGMCGKCKVEIVPNDTAQDLTSEEIKALSPEEIKMLTPEEIKGNVRLACLVKVEKDLEIKVLSDYQKQEKESRVLSQGFLPDFEKDASQEGYGLAVDIGTTTVVLSLLSLKNGAEVAFATSMNPQRQYGLDVLSRITYIREHVDGTAQMQQAIVEVLNQMIDEVSTKANITKTKIRKIAVGANCTMMHFLLGEDASGLGVYPYEPRFVSAKNVYAKELGLNIHPEAEVYCISQVSAFIGADIVAGAYVCGLHKTTGKVLFIDIGTNGEMVLANEGKLYSCSCAAGPALEGMNIRHGMSASNGAIEEVAISENGVELSTIGDKIPEGLCGSGILAIVRELLRVGLMKKSGVLLKSEELSENDYRQRLLKMEGKKRAVVLNEEPEIVVSQDDIRQVQLAKGALLSGVKTLLKAADVAEEELNEVIIAGQFGSHLSADSLTEVGIVPVRVYDKLKYVGNSSKSGAYMAILSKQAQKEMEELAERIQYIELADQEGYQELFMECMRF